MSHDDFWDRMASVNAGMLDATDGVRRVPMSHYADRDAHTLWFITAKGTDVVKAAMSGPKAAIYILSDGGKGIYADIKGTLTLSDDKAKLDALWNAVADAWFEGGKDDPDVQLVSFHITTAEVWITPTSGIVFMFDIIKANLTGDQPDMGSHYTI